MIGPEPSVTSSRPSRGPIRSESEAGGWMVTGWRLGLEDARLGNLPEYCVLGGEWGNDGASGLYSVTC